MGDDLDRARAEAVRLAAALEEATNDKIKAAEYGMMLLEQKQQLEHQLHVLQDQLDLTKTEVDRANQSLEVFRSQHKAATRTELENEETLLAESSEKEKQHLEQIAALEAELRSKQQELDRVQSELERLQANHSMIREKGVTLDEEVRRLRLETKEAKEREQRMQMEYTDLEDENIALQKTVANLRGAQVEFESLKMDCNRYAEEIYVLNAAVEDAQTLKNIAERQVEEALLTAQQEREHRLAMKRELEAAKNAEHLNQLNSMLMGMEMPAEEDNQPVGNDLFSELQGAGSEGKILELEAANESLQEEKKDREKTAIELVSTLMNKLNINYTAELDYMHARQQKDVVLDKLENLLKGGQVDAQAEKKNQMQRTDIRTLLLLAGEKSAQLAAAQDNMINLADQLYQFYHQLSVSQGQATDKSIIDLVKKLRQMARDNAEDVPKVSLAEEGLESGTETDTGGGGGKPLPLNSDRAMLAPSFVKDLEPRLVSCKVMDIASEADMRQRILTDGSAMFQTTDSLRRLIGCVKRTAEEALNQAASVGGAETEDMAMQNMKLRSLLSTKRDQITTLRTVLKSNKLTAESALASLREKYEVEKRSNQEMMERQRKELKQLKEDAATFASHRAMFTARCEELQAQVEELLAEQRSNEDEKKTLNQLLRISIQQKLTLTQRLEDVEVDRDRHSFKRGPKPATRGGGGSEAAQPRAVRYPAGGQQRGVKRDCGN